MAIKFTVTNMKESFDVAFKIILGISIFGLTNYLAYNLIYIVISSLIILSLVNILLKMNVA